MQIVPREKIKCMRWIIKIEWGECYGERENMHEGDNNM